MSHTYVSETRLLCPFTDCTPDEPGPPVYECSRCGNRDEERQCYMCGIFQAKISSTSCPDCGEALEGEEFAEVEMRMSQDGEWHMSLVEAEEWDETEPERIAALEKSRAETRAYLDAHFEERKREADAMLPVLHDALEVCQASDELREVADFLGGWAGLTRSLEMFISEAERGHPLTSITARPEEMIALFCPDQLPAVDRAFDYDLPREERDQSIDAYVAALKEHSSPALAGQWDFFLDGASGVSVDALPLLRAIARLKDA